MRMAEAVRNTIRIRLSRRGPECRGKALPRLLSRDETSPFW